MNSMSDALVDLWNYFDDGIVDQQEPACEWSESQTRAVNRFREVFGIEHEKHDYYQFRDHACMVVRFTRIPRGHQAQFFAVEIAVNDSKAALSRKEGEVATGIYLLLDGQKYSRKNLSPIEQNAIIQLYNSINTDDSES